MIFLFVSRADLRTSRPYAHHSFGTPNHSSKLDPHYLLHTSPPPRLLKIKFSKTFVQARFFSVIIIKVQILKHCRLKISVLSEIWKQILFRLEKWLFKVFLADWNIPLLITHNAPCFQIYTIYTLMKITSWTVKIKKQQQYVKPLTAVKG